MAVGLDGTIPEFRYSVIGHLEEDQGINFELQKYELGRDCGTAQNAWVCLQSFRGGLVSERCQRSLRAGLTICKVLILQAEVPKFNIKDA